MRTAGYKLYAVNDDGTETPFVARRLRLKIDSMRIVEIELTPKADHAFTLHCQAEPNGRSSRLIVHPCAANLIRVEVTPKRR